MAYNYFSQPQGPSVPVDLYANAATAGAKVGQALGTPFSNAVEGLTQGIQTGQEIVSKNQEIELNQNKLDNLPTANARQEEDLRGARLRNEVLELESGISKDTEALQLEATKESLVNKATSLKRDTALKAKEQKFNEAYQNAATPQLKKELILSGQYNDVFSNFPKTYQNAVTNPNVWGTLNKEEQNSISLGIAKRSVYDSTEKMKQAQLPEWIKANAALDNSDIGKDLAVKTGINESSKLAASVTFVPTGRYKTDDTGKLLRNTKSPPGTSDYMYDPDYVGELKTWDAIDNGRIVRNGVDPKEKALFDTVNKLRPFQDGSYQQTQLSEVEATAKKKTQQERDRPPGISPRTTPQNQTAEGIQTADTLEESANALPKFTQQQKQIQVQFNLTEKELEVIAEPISELNRLAERSVGNLQLRNSASTANIKDRLIDSISRNISDTQFQKSKVIQSEYTDKKVERYNESILEMSGNRPGTREVLAPFMINSREDLYYNSIKKALNTQLESVYMKSINSAEKRRGQIESKAESTANKNNFLNSLRQ